MVTFIKKSIYVRLVIASLFSIIILALLLFALPLSSVCPSAVLVHPSAVFGAYDNTGSATGMGEPILDKGTWFMYNTYPGGTSNTYDIQLGNPSGGTNTIGTLTVSYIGSGEYEVTYEMYSGISVIDEHLGISDTMNFTGKPGQDDNQDFGTPFEDGDDSFYMFAHFSIGY